MSLPGYPKYKSSGAEWLGEIPAHWGIYPVKRGFARQKKLNTGMICENRLSLTLGGVVPRSLSDLDGLQASEFETYQIFQSNDLVFKLIDLQNIKTSRVGIVPEMGIMSPAYIRLEPFVAKVSPKYGYWFFTDLYNRQIFNRMGDGVRQTIGQDELLAMVFCYPSVDEQTAIATFLDRETAKIDGLIAEQEKLIALLAEKRQATISHAVTKGLKHDVPMKDSGVAWLGEVPAHWAIRQLKSVSLFTTSGPRGWSERISDDGCIFVQSGDLNDSLAVEFSGAKRVIVEEGAETTRTRLSDGDVVVCITGAKTGNVAVCTSVPEPAYVNQHLCLIRPSTEILPSFLGATLKGRIGQIQFELSQYGLKQGLSLENVRETLVVLPPLPEQAAIIEFIATETARLDALTAEATHGIALLKERRSALISAAVTGKIDVRHLAEAEAA